MSDHLRTITVICELADAGIGSSHAERMALLVIAGCDGPAPIGTVADQVSVSRGAMSMISERLVDAKLLRRTHHPTDRRIVLLEPTAAARRAVSRAEQSAARTNPTTRKHA